MQPVRAISDVIASVVMSVFFMIGSLLGYDFFLRIWILKLKAWVDLEDEEMDLVVLPIRGRAVQPVAVFLMMRLLVSNQSMRYSRSATRLRVLMSCIWIWRMSLTVLPVMLVILKP